MHFHHILAEHQAISCPQIHRLNHPKYISLKQDSACENAIGHRALKARGATGVCTDLPLVRYPMPHTPISVTKWHYPNANKFWNQSRCSLPKSLVTSLGIPQTYLRLGRTHIFKDALTKAAGSLYSALTNRRPPRLLRFHNDVLSWAARTSSQVRRPSVMPRLQVLHHCP